ncbi:hypothetical protein [Iamia sp.]|uniref:hypothetical protein n=1 Tax=Iamia sp. TaxID=2722710 RepID=UPI002CAC3FBA|nr:hypothetical protein [Iamia sp.]HXH58021.1 hypothetical protein [Iamia sp.]
MPSKLLALSLAVGLALSGAACGDDDDDAGETADSVVDEVEEGAEDAGSEVEEGAEDATTAAAETAARNIASEQGEDEFSSAGEEIDGDLSCEAEAADGADTVDVTCTGTTEDGGEAELIGTTSELPGASATELEGDFTGTVDGDEVFATDRLGADDGSEDDG